MSGRAAPSVGFYGKIPARGDFVRVGLSTDFASSWDRWLQHVLVEGERRLGPGWPATWRVAPVWRFALPAGQCGGRSVVGLWLPSVDSAGRRFPLTLAVEDAGLDDTFLDAMERIGRETVAHDLTPAAIAERLQALPPCGVPSTAGRGRWWSAGGPFVAAADLAFDALPDAAGFTRMLRS